MHVGWQAGTLPATDTVPNPPRITDGYTRLVQELDFWLTDEHSDDNTQQALLDIADGCEILERYSEDVMSHVDKTGAAQTADEKKKWRERAIAVAGAYDKQRERWLIMVNSALSDVQRRLRWARTLPQVWRTLRPMPRGVNPPPLPPVSHDP